MTKACAWCQRVLERLAPLESGDVTHGICPPCEAQLVATVPAAPALTLVPRRARRPARKRPVTSSAR